MSAGVGKTCCPICRKYVQILIPCENLLTWLQLERLTPSTDGHDITEQIDVPAHGSDGPLSISLPNYALLPVDDLIMKATQDIPERFPFTQDLNTGNPLGFGATPRTCSRRY